MKLSDGPDIYGYTIFCDDLRVEVAGKLIYIGVYLGTMIVHNPFPTMLPKLVLDVVYLQRRRCFIPPKEFVIALPGETEESASIRIAVPEAVVEQAMAGEAAAKGKQSDEEWDSTLVRMGAPMAFNNLVIRQPGRLKVRASRGDELVRLGTLNIIQGSGVEANAAVPPTA